MTSERARGGVTQLVNHSEGGCCAHDSISKRWTAGNPFFFEAFDEGEVGDASPWWTGTVRVDHLANMLISRSLHRAELRGTGDPVRSIRADRIFVPTPRPYSIAPSNFLPLHQRVMQVGLVDAVGGGGENGWTEEDSQKPAVSNFGKPIRAGATHSGAGTAAGRW